MKPHGRGSLERRLLLALVAAALLFSIVAGTSVYHLAYSQETQRSRHNLDSLAATVQSAAAIAVYVTSDEIASDVMHGLLRNDEILAVILESEDGYQVMRWSDRSVPAWDQDTELDFPLFEPVYPHGRIGTLTILPDTVMLAERARKAAFMQLVLLLGHTALLGVIGVTAFRRLVGRPLFRLTRQLHHVRPGRGERIRVPAGHGDSEIGLLADSMNGYLAASEAALESERQLRERVESMEAHYRRIFESTSVGVMVLDMNGLLINCNAVVNDQLSGTGDDLDGSIEGRGGRDVFARLFRRPEKAWALVEEARAGGQVSAADLELCHHDGKRHWAHCLFSVSRSGEGEYGFIEGVLYDVTSRREREQAALRIAERDGLTDLVNRRGAEAYIERALADAQRDANGLTLMYIDLDGFKSVNDTLGHAAGDAVLIEVSRRLERVRRRSSDLLARLGGDEFVIAMYGCRKRDAAVIDCAAAVLAALGEPVALPDGTHAQIGGSMGIASYPEDGEQRSALLFAADQAMYAAKRGGRRRYAHAPGV